MFPKGVAARIQFQLLSSSMVPVTSGTTNISVYGDGNFILTGFGTHIANGIWYYDAINTTMNYNMISIYVSNTAANPLTINIKTDPSVVANTTAIKTKTDSLTFSGSNVVASPGAGSITTASFAAAATIPYVQNVINPVTATPVYDLGPEILASDRTGYEIDLTGSGILNVNQLQTWSASNISNHGRDSVNYNNGAYGYFMDVTGAGGSGNGIRLSTFTATIGQTYLITAWAKTNAAASGRSMYLYIWTGSGINGPIVALNDTQWTKLEWVWEATFAAPLLCIRCVSNTTAGATWSYYWDDVSVKEIVTSRDLVNTLTPIKAKTDQLTFTTANRVDSSVAGIFSNAITASAIADNAISETKIADNTITGNKIAAGAIQSGKFATGALHPMKFSTEYWEIFKGISGAVNDPEPYLLGSELLIQQRVDFESELTGTDTTGGKLTIYGSLTSHGRTTDQAYQGTNSYMFQAATANSGINLYRLVLEPNKTYLITFYARASLAIRFINLYLWIQSGHKPSDYEFPDVMLRNDRWTKVQFTYRSVVTDSNTTTVHIRGRSTDTIYYIDQCSVKEITEVGKHMVDAVAPIKSKTDQLQFTVANRVDSSVYGIANNTITANSIATGAFTSTKFAADAITASALAADAVSEIQSGLSTLTAANIPTALGMATGNLDTQLGNIPTLSELQDRTLPAADYFNPATDTVTLAVDQAVNVTKVAGVAVAGVNDFKADLTTLESRLTALRAGYLDKLNVAGTLANTANADTFKATGFSTHSAADVVSGVWNATRASYAGAGSFGAVSEWASAGGATPEQIWTYSTRNVNVTHVASSAVSGVNDFKADVSGLSTLTTTDISGAVWNAGRALYTTTATFGAVSEWASGEGGGGALDPVVLRAAIGLENPDLDVQLDEIKSKTNNLPDNPAAVGSPMTLEDGAITEFAYDNTSAYPYRKSGISEANAPVLVSESIVDNLPVWSWSTGGGGNGVYRRRINGGTWIVTVNLTYTHRVAEVGQTYTLEVQEQAPDGLWSESLTSALVT